MKTTTVTTLHGKL